MEIKVKGQVLILDEAHNMEDSSREAASFTTTQEEMQEAMGDFEKIANMGYRPGDMAQFVSFTLDR